MTAVNGSSGTSVWPRWFPPQQTAVPSARSAHACPLNVLTATYRPAGASAFPDQLSPQHSMDPPGRSPQLWRHPPTRVVNWPCGTAARP